MIPGNINFVLMLIALFSMHLLNSDGQIVLDGFVTQYLPPSLISVPDRPGQRLFEVYLPDGYDPAGITRYPVVYFLHGLGGAYISFPGLELVLDSAIAAGIIVPMIVIKVDGSSMPLAQGAGLNGFWYVNAFAQDGEPVPLQQYEDYLFQPDGLIAYVDQNYCTLASQPYRALMGQSMGGYGSLWLGINHADYFSAYCSDSGTPPWVLYTDLANSNTMLFCNTVLTETSASLNGLIQPGGSLQKPFTNTVYSHVNAWSVLSTDTATFPYDVTLPFLVTGTQLPGAGVIDSTGSLISNTLTLARISQKDPYTYIATQSISMNQQIIYLDAGSNELINGAGAAYFSDSLCSYLLDHEYLLFTGGHTYCLTTESCSRFLTNLQRISASFASGGIYADNLRAKLQGVLNITLTDNASLMIKQGAILGIETSNTSNSVINTAVQMTIAGNAALRVGTDTLPGGALQVGDRTTKARLEGMPSLGSHTIHFSLIIDGPGALFQIGQQGFVGFGVGIDGQMPCQPNFWGVSTLSNVQSIALIGNQGALEHTHIASGDSCNASLIAFGSPGSSTISQTLPAYTWGMNPAAMTLLGGGNIVQVVDGLVMHPTILTATGLAPTLGARTIINSGTYVPDSFYNQNQASTTCYTNQISTDILASSITLQDPTKREQLPLNGVSVSALFAYLALNDYEYQETKSTDIATFQQSAVLGYVDEDQIQRTAVYSLIPISPYVLQRIVGKGGAGIKLVTRNGQRQILRLYDLEPLP